jgi:hypothetical protein
MWFVLYSMIVDAIANFLAYSASSAADPTFSRLIPSAWRKPNPTGSVRAAGNRPPTCGTVNTIGDVDSRSRAF